MEPTWGSWGPPFIQNWSPICTKTYRDHPPKNIILNKKPVYIKSALYNVLPITYEVVRAKQTNEHFLADSSLDY
jgi:hypothetical protein